ncbi:hypothetical protein GW17_00036027 [Ensete ventricosum]|nr:hypothetical protein GW17_00036027 [Ensete ventricosum]
MDLSALCDMSNLSALRGMSKVYVGKSGPAARATTSLPDVEEVHAEVASRTASTPTPRRPVKKSTPSEGGFAPSTSKGVVHAAARGAHGVGGKANHIGKSCLDSLVLVSFRERMV